MRQRDRLNILTLLVISLAAPSIAADASQSRLLNTRLPELRFDAVSLRDAIDFLRDTAGLNVHVNWQALEATGVAGDTQVSLNLRNVAARKALQMVLNEAAGDATLTYYVADNVVHVTTRAEADRQHVTRIYPVGDLLVEIPNFTNAPTLDIETGSGGGESGGGGGRGGGGGGGGGDLFGAGGDAAGGDAPQTRAERADALIQLITSVIEPDVWQQNGGTASIVIFQDRLVVTAPRSVHQALGR